MNEPFVPLSNVSVSGGDRSGLHVTIVNPSEKLQPFQPLGRAGHGAGQCEPRVTLQRDGDRISAIHIQCACGQVVELACVYEKAKG
jgi:hypothetical protein